MSNYLSLKKQRQLKKKNQRGKSIDHASNGTYKKAKNPEINQTESNSESTSQKNIKHKIDEN